MQDLVEILQTQIEKNSRKNLLYKDIGAIIEVDLCFIEKLNEVKETLTHSQVKELIHYTVKRFIRTIYQINQFIQIKKSVKNELEGIYESTWNILKDSNYIKQSLCEHHYPALSKWIGKIYPEAFVVKWRNRKYINTIPCAEYSPEFQIRLLNINEQSLREPILDIGCGSTAALVHYLKQKGKEVTGIDREIDTPAPYLFEADWLDYYYEKGKWGTIISNISFTNHMRYVFWQDQRDLCEYMDKYHEILESFSYSGCFYYAPQVEYAEKQIDYTRFQIERYLINNQYKACRVRKFEI
jgi:hypothetical protein